MKHEELLDIINKQVEEVSKLPDFKMMSIYKTYMMITTLTLASIVELDDNELFGMIMAKINTSQGTKTLNI